MVSTWSLHAGVSPEVYLARIVAYHEIAGSKRFARAPAYRVSLCCSLWLDDVSEMNTPLLSVDPLWNCT